MSKKWIYSPYLINPVVRCARAYEKELDGNTLLLVCMDKHRHLSYMEVSFHSRNFLHLTGTRLKGPMSVSAEDLYNKSISHNLAFKDLVQAPDSITPSKLETLPFVAYGCLCASMVTDYSTDSPVIYTEKLPGGFKGCIQLARDAETGLYVPSDMRKVNLHRLSKAFVRVIATYRKGAADERYSEIVHTAKDIDWNRIQFSREYSYLPKPV
ncbi:MAG: PBECR4 domain-containing protein [Clostridia bacterium]|nr:PBECR4 domain-containing protein [Clostridia bacterium]